MPEWGIASFPGYHVMKSVRTGTVVPCTNRDCRNSDRRVAEVRKFCKRDEAEDNLFRAAMSNGTTDRRSIDGGLLRYSKSKKSATYPCFGRP